MRIQPRQRLLEIWRATAAASYPSGPSGEGKWAWGGRDLANSISDAEQLLCIMLPATEIPRFRLDQPDRTHEEVLSALRQLGDAREIPRLLVRILTDYLRRYSAEDGTPLFPGGSLFGTADPEAEATGSQLGLDVVESFAESITLTLSALGFARVFRGELTRADLRAEVDTLEELASRRLSAAMVGLLRSFTISVFDADSVFGKALLRTVNQAKQPAGKVLADLSEALRDTAAGLRDLNVGIERVADLDRPGRLFECGWSWGITTGAPKIDFAEGIGIQREGYALDSPYLYFTVVALDGIADLFSDRTRLLGLLDDNQQRLSAALQIRWDLTQQYWATVASFGEGRWPLEDIPWRTIDEAESDFFSLLVTSIAARDLARRRDTDADLSRLGTVLTELANRGRLTRRPFVGDPAVRLHEPGVTISLEGSEAFGPQLTWTAADFAPLLLKRSLRIAGLINDIELRGQMLSLADDVWDHVSERRLKLGPGQNLWDQPADAFSAIQQRFTQPTWHHTVRVVESLVFAANLAESHPLRSTNLTVLAQDLLAEAEHLFDQELLAGSTEGGRSIRERLESVRQRLRRSREIMLDRPGSSVSLLLAVLGDLDALARARQDIRGKS
jgi:hypothetical protein